MQNRVRAFWFKMMAIWIVVVSLPALILTHEAWPANDTIHLCENGHEANFGACAEVLSPQTRTNFSEGLRSHCREFRARVCELAEAHAEREREWAAREKARRELQEAQTMFERMERDRAEREVRRAEDRFQALVRQHGLDTEEGLRKFFNLDHAEQNRRVLEEWERLHRERDRAASKLKM